MEWPTSWALATTWSSSAPPVTLGPVQTIIGTSTRSTAPTTINATILKSLRSPPSSDPPPGLSLLLSFHCLSFHYSFFSPFLFTSHCLLLSSNLCYRFIDWLWPLSQYHHINNRMRAVMTGTSFSGCTAYGTTKNTGTIPIPPSTLCVQEFYTGFTQCNPIAILPGSSYAATISVVDIHAGNTLTFTIMTPSMIADCLEDSHTTSGIVPYNPACVSNSPTITPTTTISITASISVTASVMPSVTPTSSVTPSISLSATSSGACVRCEVQTNNLEVFIRLTNALFFTTVVRH